MSKWAGRRDLWLGLKVIVENSVPENFVTFGAQSDDFDSAVLNHRLNRKIDCKFFQNDKHYYPHRKKAQVW